MPIAVTIIPYWYQKFKFYFFKRAYKIVTIYQVNSVSTGSPHRSGYAPGEPVGTEELNISQYQVLFFRG